MPFCALGTNVLLPVRCLVMCTLFCTGTAMFLDNEVVSINHRVRPSVSPVRQTFVYIISSHYIKCELFSFLVLQILSLCLLVRLFSICFSILFFIPNLTNNASFNLFLTTRLKDTQVSLTRLRPVASKSVKALIVLV